MEISETLVRSLLDMVVGSMDYGSGFMVDEQVADLRQVARELGMDPHDVTPPLLRSPWCAEDGHRQYPTWVPNEGSPPLLREQDRCACGQKVRP